MTFSVLALRDWLRKNKVFDSRSYSTTVTQIIFTGVDALPTITFLGLTTGFIFTFRLIDISHSLGGTDNISNLLISVICLSVGPFIAAIIIINRTGSAIVVDLGNMKLHGEIEPLSPPPWHSGLMLISTIKIMGRLKTKLFARCLSATSWAM